MTLIPEPQLDPTHAPGDVAGRAVDEQLLEQKEVAGLSQMPDRPPAVLPPQGRDGLAGRARRASSLLAVTSIGVGPIPGWWKYDYTDVVPPNPDDGADDVAAADVGSAAPASSSATTRSASTTRSAGTCSR